MTKSCVPLSAEPLDPVIRPLRRTIISESVRLERDIAYAAGLFEGEGCIAISAANGRSGKVQYWLRCIVRMTDPEPVAFLHQMWGGSHTVPTTKHRVAYQWATSSKEAAAFLCDIRPYLISERRRKAADLAITFQAQKINQGRRIDVAYAKRQEDFHSRLRWLNQGPRG